MSEPQVEPQNLPGPGPSLTPEEEWEIINTSTFDQNCRERINSIREDLTHHEAFAYKAIETNVDGVYVKFEEEVNFINVDCGHTAQGEPQVRIRIPIPWLET
jgi:hypothetical protein